MKLIGWDVESWGKEPEYALQPFRARTGDAWLTTCAMATEDGVTVGEVRPTREYLRKFLERCAASGVTICGWNVPFDMGWLIAMGLTDEVNACRWLDGMMLWRHLTASPEWTGLAPASYGLKAAVKEFLPAHAGYEDDVAFDVTDAVGLAKLLQYNKRDALFTVQLCKMFLARLTDKQKRNALIEAECLSMVARANVDGIKGNREAAAALSDKLDEQASVAICKLAVQTDSGIDASVLASPTKLRKLLFEDWGLKPVKRTEKGADSTDRDALSQLAEVDPRAALLNEYREAKNNRTKFAEGMIKSLDYNGDGMTRPTLKPYGTYSGRCTVGSKVGRGKNEKPTGVPQHQWKRTPDFRNLVDAPEGYTLLEWDYSGQEGRWMAYLSGDEGMLAMCEPGEDMHSYMGASIARLPYKQVQSMAEVKGSQEAEYRQMGKVSNLSLAYRTSASTLERVARVQYGLKLTSAQARAIHGTYRTTYPMVPMYWKNQIALARRQGWVETVAGRRVHVGLEHTWSGHKFDKDNNFVPFDNKWGCESTAINFPIQGTGADQKYLALAALKDMLNEYNSRLYFELHDGVYVLTPDHLADKFVRLVRDRLSNLPYKKLWGVDLPIQFPVDAKMGKAWGSLKKVD